jgi:hypothetical protein
MCQDRALAATDLKDPGRSRSQASAAQKLDIRLVIAPSHLIPFGCDKLSVAGCVHWLRKALRLLQRLTRRERDSRFRVGGGSCEAEALQRVNLFARCLLNPSWPRLCIEYLRAVIPVPTITRSGIFSIVQSIISPS